MGTVLKSGRLRYAGEVCENNRTRDGTEDVRWDANWQEEHEKHHNSVRRQDGEKTDKR